MKFSVLFGAGADSCFQIAVGSSFVKEIICGNYSTEIKLLLGDSFNDYKLIDKRCTSFFLQTIFDNQDEAKKALGELIVTDFVNYYTQTEKSIKYDIIKSKCNEWLDHILANDDKAIVDFFLKKGELFDAIDSKFNSLRDLYNRDKLNANAIKIISTYSKIFIFLMYQCYDNLTKESFTLKNINTILKTYQLKNINNDSYYNYLVNKDCYIFTTNYTDYCKKITKREDIVYLHGNFHMFENYKTLEVNMLNNYTNFDNLFPFILIPSGVKPIISKYQIKEYNKFITYLDETNRLFVVGYQFNKEDNHINSIIRDWLMKSHNNIIYFYNIDEHAIENLGILKEFKSQIINCCFEKDIIIKKYAEKIREIDDISIREDCIYE